MQTENEKLIEALQEKRERKVILVIGRGSVSALRTFAVCKHALEIACCNVDIEAQTQAQTQELQKAMEAIKGTAVLPKIPLAVYAKPIIAEKPLPTYRQDKSKKYFKRFLR